MSFLPTTFQQNQTSNSQNTKFLSNPCAFHNIVSPIPQYREYLIKPQNSECAQNKQKKALQNYNQNQLVKFQEGNYFSKWTNDQFTQFRSITTFVPFEVGQIKRKCPEKQKKLTSKLQNLKNVSNYIKSVISHSPNLSIKFLSYLLYEIISETQFGLCIKAQNFTTIGESQLDYLNKKYYKNEVQNQELKSITKNVRRRLYDALNVMIAAGVLIKNEKNILNLKSELKCTFDETQESEAISDNLKKKQNKSLQILQSEYDEKLKQINFKKSLLTDLTKKYLLQKILIKRNKQKEQQNIGNQEQLKLELPLVIFKNNAGMKISFDNNQLLVESNQKIQIVSDLQMINMLTQEDSQDKQQIKLKLEES